MADFRTMALDGFGVARRALRRALGLIWFDSALQVKEACEVSQLGLGSVTPVEMDEKSKVPMANGVLVGGTRPSDGGTTPSRSLCFSKLLREGERVEEVS